MVAATEPEILSRLSKADEIALRTMGPEDQKLIQRLRAAFGAYETKLEKWNDNPIGSKPAPPDVVRFAPYLKKYEGGITVNLWPGSSKFNSITGSEDVKSSVHLDIRQGGHTPATLDEALRLLVLARMPNHQCGIVTWDRKEMAPDLKTAELQNTKLREELAAKDDALEAAKREIEALKAGKK